MALHDRIKRATLIVIFFFILAAHGSFLVVSAYSNGEFHKKAVEQAGGDEDAAVKVPPGISASGQPLPEEAQQNTQSPANTETSAQTSSQPSDSSQKNTGEEKSSQGAAVTVFIVLAVIGIVVLGLQYISTKSMIEKK